MAAGGVEVDKPDDEGGVEAEAGDQKPGVELPAGPDGSGEDAGSEGGGVVVVRRRWIRGKEGGALGWRWEWKWRGCANGCQVERGGRVEGRGGEEEVEAGERRRGC